MSPFSVSEHALIKEFTQVAQKMKMAGRGLPVGALIKLIRTQLRMSQKILAKRARVPQSTVSRIERGQGDANLSTLQKILNALSCDLVVAPVLRESIDTLRRRQARSVAERHVRYLKGTMSLEEQQPDSWFLEEVVKREEEQLLHSSGTKLWEE